MYCQHSMAQNIIPFQKGGDWHSEEILGLSKTKTQQGKHQILQLHVQYLDFGFKGPRWFCPSTVAAWNTHFLLGWFQPHMQLWYLQHLGIFTATQASPSPFYAVSSHGLMGTPALSHIAWPQWLLKPYRKDLQLPPSCIFQVSTDSGTGTALHV